MSANRFEVRPRADATEDTSAWELVIPEDLYERLQQHLFPGDGDEHGAVLLAGLAKTPVGLRVLVRDLVTACDGTDYVPGARGYRMLTAAFVTRMALRCGNEELCYIAVHNHGGQGSVAFSADDTASHRRGYPALLDVVGGKPVGALVIADGAAAGTLWLSSAQQIAMRCLTVVGRNRVVLAARPTPRTASSGVEYDRQVRVFGDRGQDALAQMRVVIVGLGGIGCMLAELLGRLGVGHFVLIDPDIIEASNLPRMIGARRMDAMPWLTDASRPAVIRRLGAWLATSKVRHAHRVIRRANPRAVVRCLRESVVEDHVARELLTADHIFLAADSMQARLVCNAIAHAHLIPMTQVGVKIPVDQITGAVGDMFAVSRRVVPSSGCLLCNGLIPGDALQREAETPRERAAQRYIDDENIHAPSVVTMNAAAATHAANEFMMWAVGLREADAFDGFWYDDPRQNAVVRHHARRDPACGHCGRATSSLFALGDAAPLFTRLR